jgi:hypothetical protein
MADSAAQRSDGAISEAAVRGKRNRQPVHVHVAKAGAAASSAVMINARTIRIKLGDYTFTTHECYLIERVSQRSFLTLNVHNELLKLVRSGVGGDSSPSL